MDWDIGNRTSRQAFPSSGQAVLVILQIKVSVLLSNYTYLPRDSLSVTARLNTGLPGFVSTRSATK